MGEMREMFQSGLNAIMPDHKKLEELYKFFTEGKTTPPTLEVIQAAINERGIKGPVSITQISIDGSTVTTSVERGGLDEYLFNAVKGAINAKSHGNDYLFEVRAF